MGVVHVAVTRTVLPGCEEAFETKLQNFVRNSIGVDGLSGIHILKPPDGSDSREYGILRSFENEEAAERFYSSPLFGGWLKEVQPLVNGEPFCRRLTGLEAFFRSGGSSLPPRWKMAIITFIEVLPTALLWSSLLAPITVSAHWIVRAVAVNAAIVMTLTWVVMPFLTRTCEHWLRPAGKLPATHGER